MSDEFIHTYNAPPRVGDVALCGHVREDELEGARLIRSDNCCAVCEAISGAEGRTTLSRSPLIEDPRVWVREPERDDG